MLAFILGVQRDGSWKKRHGKAFITTYHNRPAMIPRWLQYGEEDSREEARNRLHIGSNVYRFAYST